MSHIQWTSCGSEGLRQGRQSSPFHVTVQEMRQMHHVQYQSELCVFIALIIFA